MTISYSPPQEPPRTPPSPLLSPRASMPCRGLSPTSPSSSSPSAAAIAAISPISSLVEGTVSLRKHGCGPYRRLVPPPLLCLSQFHQQQHEKIKTSSSTPQDETLQRLQRKIAQLEGDNLTLRQQVANLSSFLPPSSLRAPSSSLLASSKMLASPECTPSSYSRSSSSQEGCPPFITTATFQTSSSSLSSPATKYPLGVSRFSWPPGSPAGRPGRSMAEALEEAQQLEEKFNLNSITCNSKGSYSSSISNGNDGSGSPRRAGGRVVMGATSVLSSSPAALASAHFSEFAVVGIQSSILRGLDPPAKSMQPVEVIAVEMGETPEGEKRGGTTPSSAALARISEFCFPQGGRLELAPASQLELWTGKHRDQTHVLQFMDEQGATSYGVCLTIYEARPECPSSVVEALQQVRKEHAAARTLQHFCMHRLPAVAARAGAGGAGKRTLRKSCSNSDNPNVENISSSSSSSSRSGQATSRNRLLDDSTSPFAIAAAAAERRGLLDHVRTHMRKLQQGGGWGTPRRSRERRGSSSSSSSSSRVEGGGRGRKLVREGSVSLEEYQKLVRATEALGGSAVVSTCQYGASLTYREFRQQEEEEVGFVVVAPRCFCLISHQPNHPVLCKVLSFVVERERAVPANYSGGTMKVGILSALKRRHSCNTLSLPSSSSSSPSSGSGGGGMSLSPKATGSYMEKYGGGGMDVSMGGAGGVGGGSSSSSSSSGNSGSSGGEGDLVTLRRRFLRHVQREMVFPSSGSVPLSYPPYSPATTRLDFPLVPLQDWAVAVLFSHVSAGVIIKCVNLLLLEQSLVVIGEDQGLVSAIATAFISLLQPFKWDGVFIPLLPNSLSDIVQSPVPFVLGVQPPFDPSHTTPHAAALHIGRCKEHLRLPDLAVKLPLCYQLLQALQESSKLFSCRRSRWANLHLATYMGGLTTDETQALVRLKATLREYVQGLCGDLAYPEAWRKYGTFDSEREVFEFFPGWFLDPLRMMVEYQSAFVHTQMFSSYVDRRRGEDLERARTKTRNGMFLAACLAFKWRTRLRRRWREEEKEEEEEQKGRKEPQVVREGMRKPFQGYVVKPSGLRIEEEEGEEKEEDQHYL